MVCGGISPTGMMNDQPREVRLRGQRARDWSRLLAVLCITVAANLPGGGTNTGFSLGTNGGVLLNGQSYRAIGVNYYDAFVRLLNGSNPSEIEARFHVLASNQIPFIRFSAGGYWPVNWGMYQTNRVEHFRRLGEVVKLAERYNLGLIPSLFWHQPTISDLVGEPADEWGNSHSRTHEFMRTYTREVVTRLKDSPALWAWEFGNEFNLVADLPNAAKHRPPVNRRLGTPGSRSARDELTHTHVRTALVEFAREVRRHDPHRLIFSGNAFPRPSAWHQQREGSWRRDSPEQWAEMLAADNPNPIGSLSGRLYSTNDLKCLPTAAELSRQLGKPLFIGEFGVPGAMTDDARDQFRQTLDALEVHDVPLAALWVFDFEWQAKEWSVTADNFRREQLQGIAERNRRWNRPRP